MELHQLELSAPLPDDNLAGAAHRLVMAGMESDVRPLFFVVSRRHVVVLAGEGAFNPRRLGARLREAQRKRWHPNFAAGTALNFRLRLCVERRHGAREAARPASDAEIMDRLRNVAEGAGFEVGAATFEREGGMTMRRGGVTVRLRSALVSGQLRVVDPERFHAALATGLGRKRTFGFGMLQVF